MAENKEVAKVQANGEKGGGFMQFIIGLVIGAGVVGGAWYFSASNDGSSDMTNSDDTAAVVDDNANVTISGITTNVVTTAQPQGEALVVTNQSAGDAVFVDSATVSGVSWVAVRTADGARILGAARLEESGFEIPVSLLAPTVAGESYEVVVFVDDGDRSFNHRLDALVQGVSASFTAL